MSLAARMFDDDALSAPTTVSSSIHLNWYRSLPLSSLKTVELTVNGEAIDRDEITFVVNGDDTHSTTSPGTGTRPGSPRPGDDPCAASARATGDAAEVTVRLGNRSRTS